MSSVMIAEDDLLMADMLEEALEIHGYEVCGIARTVKAGVELGDRCKPDFAVLDMRLAEGGLGTEIAAGLHSRGLMGILYASGNASKMVLTKTDGDAYLGKPYRPEDVVRSLEIIEEMINTGVASPPFPSGFTLLNGSAPNRTDALAEQDLSESVDVRRLLRQQAALAKFGSFALRERDLGAVLTEAARVCASGLGVPFCKVCQYRPVENDLLVVAGVGWGDEMIGSVISKADYSSPQGRAFVTEEPVICSNVNEDESFAMPTFYAKYGIVSTVGVVIKWEGRQYGILEVGNPIRHEYDRHDVDFLTGFANVLAEAVSTNERAMELQRTIEEMQSTVADRDRLLKSQNAVLAENGTILAAKTRLLDERNVLAEELQHRVRNNLQLVHGMLNRQLQFASDPRAGLEAIARRVMTLAKAYDHLLGTGLTRTIEFNRYLASLCSDFTGVEVIEHPSIVLTCKLEPITLDLDSVTALGLVASELIANCYKHAFPDGAGAITVSLCQSGADEGTLIVADDGRWIGNPNESRRHGLGLVKRLMKQVGGLATVRLDHGTEWTLNFPLLPVQLAVG